MEEAPRGLACNNNSNAASIINRSVDQSKRGTSTPVKYVTRLAAGHRIRLDPKKNIRYFFLARDQNTPRHTTSEHPYVFNNTRGIVDAVNGLCLSSLCSNVLPLSRLAIMDEPEGMHERILATAAV